jgi:two-component system, NarL family, nitrate/nitrite response regulator NarL
MNPALRQISPRRQDDVHSRTENAVLSNSTETANSAVLPAGRAEAVKRRVRVRMVLDSRQLQTAMSNALAGRNDIEAVNAGLTEVFRPETLTEPWPDVLVLSPRGSLSEDISLIRAVRNSAPSIRIVMFGGLAGDSEFLQYVRAGIRAYVPADGGIENILEALLLVCEGSASCPSSLCGTLFHYLEREATSSPSAGARQRLGLTRREQQLIPLIAKGFTNKEIANHFCLSEQTIKNHLYRMKHKVGAGNRLGIVQTCHTQGFLL